MSMHEIEGLVEDSINLLERSGDTQYDYRSLFAVLYDFQGQFDTGFTHFRVMPILIKHRFVYVFPLTAHPEYAAYKTLFESMRGFEWIHREPDKPYSQDNPAVGYFSDRESLDAAFSSKPLLYCDAGSELWTAFVKNGTLTEGDAELPKPLRLFDAVLRVMHVAEAQHDTLLIANWYKMGLLYYSAFAFQGEVESELSESDDATDVDSTDRALVGEREKKILAVMKSDAVINAIRELVQRTGALHTTIDREPDVSSDYMSESPLMRWWLFME
jgi:hypothetical protein